METKVIQKYEAQGSELLIHAESIVIVDDTTRELAVEFTSNARKAIKAIEAEFRPDIDKAHQLHRDLLARLKMLSDPFKRAKTIVDAKISLDYLEQEKIRREAERKAELEAAAERKRQEEARAKEINEAIEVDDMELAEALVESEVVTAPIVPVAKMEQTTRTAAGSTTVKKDIKVELLSTADVIEAVFKGKLPDIVLSVDMGSAKRYFKAGGIMTAPGFRITETAVVSGRTG